MLDSVWVDDLSLFSAKPLCCIGEDTVAKNLVEMLIQVVQMLSSSIDASIHSLPLMSEALEWGCARCR